MRRSIFGQTRSVVPLRLPLAALLFFSSMGMNAQTPASPELADQLQQLNQAMGRVQAEIDRSQQEMEGLRRQVAAIQQQMSSLGTPPPAEQPPTPATQIQAAVDELRERQAMQEAQIATHEQSKVESESKYPLKLSGLVLLNGFVNTKQVDVPATPTLALSGSGSTGASVRQTFLQLNARGPHLLGARSRADVRVDFDGAVSPDSNGSGSGYTSAYGGGSELVGLRTVHAALDWEQTQMFFSLDRPILNPDSPASLTAIAEPALAWSGNLWSWNPQLGLAHDFSLTEARQVRIQAALMDVADPPVSPILPNSYQSPGGAAVSTGEQSRWPGSELRIALQRSGLGRDAHIGLGGYFAPHRASDGYRFDSWAGSVDYRLPLPGRLELTGSVYRGAALGSLGGGAYKDFVYRIDEPSMAKYYRPLDDAGGWSQLQEKVSERLQFNAAFGMDGVFAAQLRPYAGAPSAFYQNLARNRTITGNVIYSPSAYLLFSVEYRRLESSPVTGWSAGSNVIGLGAGYKF